MMVLFQKLKAWKVAFKVWNKEVFGDVYKMVDSAQANLDKIQKDIAEYGFNDDLSIQEKQAHASLQEALSFQEEF